jgi:signal transduction histidine kinase
MKLPPLALPRLEVPRLGLVAFSRRILVRAVFLLLALATLALAVVLLQEEKERSLRNYEQGFRKTQAEITARLRHPAGQLALLNPDRTAAPSATGRTGDLRPLLLPYGALDFDDQYKAQQAVETAGCNVQYPDGSAICVAVGNNAYAGGFIYLVGSFNAPALVPRERGVLDLAAVHRARVNLTLRGETVRWVAPFELVGEPAAEGTAPALRANTTGRLTGFADEEPPLASLPMLARPQRDFRGWLWQGSRCTPGSGAASADPANCLRRAFFSIRLPVEAYREALFGSTRPAWPPADLDQTLVRLQMLGPGSDAPLFDSNAPGATAPQALGDLTQALQSGEVLRIRRLGGSANAKPREVATLRGEGDATERTAPWLSRLIAYLPAGAVATPALQGREVIATTAGSYEVTLSGSARGVEQTLSAVATRMSWYVGAMLGAILLAWLVIELGLLRQVKVLTRRAAAVSYNVNAPQVDQRVGALDVSDLRGKDELGILAGALADLLQRVKDDVKREHIRAQQERDMWHAVGHEIMSPLQSLMVLHPGTSDASHRYVQRMQQAVRVLYGQASPSEALQAATLQVGMLDLDAFLRTVAGNAHFAGVQGVRYEREAEAVLVRADDFSLEDVVTHILRNADRYRTPGTPITLALQVLDDTATVTVHNQGPQIEPGLLERIFDYGVSGPGSEPAAPGQRGQGLFVAKTYMAKMGGTIEACNTADGVSFLLTLLK